ncbi:MAG: hypothetical protein ACTS27_02835 [Phycisphaerales bacterium]
MKFVAAFGMTGLLAQQAACPIVAALAAVAPTPQMVAAMDAQGAEDCPPCQAGAVDCVQRLLEWLDAQVRGDPTVPFPQDCMENEAVTI